MFYLQKFYASKNITLSTEPKDMNKEQSREYYY